MRYGVEHKAYGTWWPVYGMRFDTRDAAESWARQHAADERATNLRVHGTEEDAADQTWNVVECASAEELAESAAMATQTYPDYDVHAGQHCERCGMWTGGCACVHCWHEANIRGQQTYPDNGELDVEAYEGADAHDVYAGAWFFDPGAPSRDELYFDSETMRYADEPEHIWADMIINKAGDSGRVVNWASA